VTPASTTGPTMPAAIQTGIAEMEIEERPVPDVGPHDVLIEVSHCGICGSDLHFVMEGWSPNGRIHGHEYSGVVAAIGAEVADWSIGDRVVGGADIRCGRCEPCRAGRPSLCIERDAPGQSQYQGAFARYKLLPAVQLLAVPKGLELRQAALAEPLAVALHAVNRSGIVAGRTALVSGIGPIGALVIAVLRHRGITSITAVEPNESRRQLAATLGADVVLEPSALELPSIAEPGRIVDGAVDVVFECSGKRPAMEAGLGQLTRTGTLMLVGAGIEAPRFDPNRILLNELVISGAFEYDPDGFVAALALLGDPAFPTDELIEPDDTHLDEIVATMHGLVNGDRPRKAMVVPTRSTEP
jgi:threonine dehydrogenase-like Zn-dependent dehydrogenase